MNFKNLLARLSGAESDIKELKKIRGMASKLAKANAADEDKEDENSSEDDEDKKDDDEDKSKNGKKSSKSESEEDDKNEAEDDEDEETSDDEDKKDKEDDDEPSASAIFEALISENKSLRAEVKRLRGDLSSDSRIKQVNAEASRLIASSGRKAPLKTKVSGGSNSAKKTVTRTEFSQMSAKDRKAFSMAGGRITD